MNHRIYYNNIMRVRTVATYCPGTWLSWLALLTQYYYYNYNNNYNNYYYYYYYYY